jgi:DUF1707 SHOCT-like domain
MSNQYFLARIVGRDPDLRASDADREQVAERLRRGHGEGRLDLDEFQERLDRCYAAKTMGELAQLVRDLPRLEDRDEQGWAWLRPSSWALVGLTPILIVLLIAAAAMGHHVLWLWLPIGFLVWRLSWRRRRRWADARRGPGGWI